MSKIKEAVHECDFCNSETAFVRIMYFDSKSNFLRGHEYNNHTFELCSSCYNKSAGRGWVISALKRVLGIK